MPFHISNLNLNEIDCLRSNGNKDVQKRSRRLDYLKVHDLHLPHYFGLFLLIYTMPPGYAF